MSKRAENIKDDELWTVYVHINKINGKTYVGITRLSSSKRWGNKGYGYRYQPFYKAIKKYGWDNFEHFIFANNLTEDEAVKMESFLIVKLESLMSQNGYNVSLGGDFSKAKMRKVAKYNPFGECIEIYNSIFDAAEANNIDEATISDVCIRRFYSAAKYGWRYIDEYEGDGYLNIAAEFPRDKYDKFYPILQFDLKGNFVKRYDDSFSLPSDFNRKYVQNCCRGKSKRANGYAWTYEVDIKDTNSFIPKKWNNYSVRRRAIVQLTLDGSYVRRFESAFEAGKILHYNASTINQVCRGNGKTKTTHGYRFEYEDNYLKGIHNYIPSDLHLPIKVQAISEDGKIVERFKSLTDAAQYIGLKRSMRISKYLDTGKLYHGFYWEKCK